MAHGDVAGLLRRRGYNELRKIGEGSFGKALLVENKDDRREQYVCKMVDVSKASRKEAEDAAKEAMLLSKLRHPYIVRYHESFTDNGWLCILMDFCEGGDLSKKISTARKSRSPFSEDVVMKLFTQAISALKYIHDQHILHRDLKPQNFFLTKSGDMKMGDFGIAKVLACTIAVARTQIGTPYYLSPELCQEKPYTWPSDIWAMGCILYELCALKVPFDAPNIPGLVQKITRAPVPKVPNQYSSFVQSLAERMLNRNPDRRPSTEDILRMPEVQVVYTGMASDAAPVMKNTPSVAGSVAGDGPSPPPRPDPEEGGSAGGYSKGDLVEYLSTAHKGWLPARVINVNAAGSIIIDLKPNTWIGVEEQATKVRPRSEPKPVPAARAPSPGMRRSPSVGSARGASPRMNTPGRAPSPRGSGIGRTPSGPAAPMIQRSPSIGSANGRPPSVRGASPMINRTPSIGQPPPMRAESPMMKRNPSSGSNAAVPSWGSYKVGDLVEFLSTSHKEWLPASVIRVDTDGRIIIDLKPNTWLTKDEQQNRVRPRKQVVPAYQQRTPGSRGASPMLPRNVSVERGYIAMGTPGSRAATPSRGAMMTPGRAPSPRRGLGSGPPSRCASPRIM
eukprot:TRINITY_DN904_c0_g2_i1.p1 TRINITY_DN904_c0_g2~~TRINITY_DN904_c0_g2_i1.p1  ORF type:complete len:618 (+),score=75.41 TRINITY_DN904_c0_g2_i1:94-1947(+)